MCKFSGVFPGREACIYGVSLHCGVPFRGRGTPRWYPGEVLSESIPIIIMFACDDVSQPAWAVRESLASETLSPLSCWSSSIRALSRPISSASSLNRKSLSRKISINIRQTPSAFNGKSGKGANAIAGFVLPFNTPGCSIVPSPFRIQEAEKLYCSHNSAIRSTPAFILLFRISENLAGLTPRLCAILVFVSPLSCRRLLMAAIKRLFISDLSMFVKK